MLSRLGRGLISAGLVVVALGVTNVAAQTPVAVVATDFKFDRSAYTATAGSVTLNLSNQGARPHDITIGRGTEALFKVPASGPAQAGQSASGAFTFQPGTYDMWCSVGNHRAQGMVATFTVSAAAGASAAPAAAPAAAAPAAALPRTGEPAALLGGLLAGSGAVLAVAGAYLRRRSS